MLSKNEEIQKFNRWYRSLEDGSYLQMIFKGIGGYVDSQIKADMGIPIEHRIEDAFKEASKAHQDAVEIGRENETIKNKFRWLAPKIGRKALKLRRALKKERRMHEHTESRMTHWHEKKQEQQIRAVEAERKVDKLQAEVKKNFKVIVNQNLKIIRLKQGFLNVD